MHNNWNKSSIVIVLIILVTSFEACTQTSFQVITHNDTAYWSRYWTPNDPHGSIVEFSKNDSSMKSLNEDWAYDNLSPALWGLKFKIINDTLLTYVNRKGTVLTYDTLAIVSYSKNRLILKNECSEIVVWHRLPTKLARKYINAPSYIRLSTLLKKESRFKNQNKITDIVWKLYGYGIVSTGIVKKSESLNRKWMNIIKFCRDGTLTGLLTHNNIHGTYTICQGKIEFSIFDKGGLSEGSDGNVFCDALIQCEEYMITDRWLQLFYNNNQNYLLFKMIE